MKRLLLSALLLVGAVPAPAQTRLASDFEIAQMRKQIAASRDFLSQLSGRLNLGDLHMTRRDVATAREEYGRAFELALNERIKARRESDITRYATATAYAGLAQAKLGRGGEAFDLLEEAMRYSGDSAKSWNLYATAMNILVRPQKSLTAARNAVSIASHEVQRAPSTESRLDLAIYQYTLAAALIDTGDSRGAERLLRGVIDSLGQREFEALRRQIERAESFEIYSTARGEAAAYLSLLNRSELRLAALLESRGAEAAAREIYLRVVERRTDDATALAGLARLGPVGERSRYLAAAFDANPFSLPLVRQFQRHLAGGGKDAADTSSTGGKLRSALAQMQRGENRSARATLDELLREFPNNSTLQLLARELDSPGAAPSFLFTTPPGRVAPSAEDLRRLVSLAASERLAAKQRAALDTITFASTVMFSSAAAGAPGQTILAAGTIETIPFRFAEPTAFVGSISAGVPLRLTYRFLGATEIDGSDALLLEPLGLEVAP